MKIGMVIAPDSGSTNPNLGLGSSFSCGVTNIFALPHSKCTCTVKVVTQYTCVCTNHLLSITVQRTGMKFCVVIAPKGGYFISVLWH